MAKLELAHRPPAWLAPSHYTIPFTGAALWVTLEPLVHCRPLKSEFIISLPDGTSLLLSRTLSLSLKPVSSVSSVWSHSCPILFPRAIIPWSLSPCRSFQSYFKFDLPSTSTSVAHKELSFHFGIKKKNFFFNA